MCVCVWFILLQFLFRIVDNRALFQLLLLAQHIYIPSERGREKRVREAEERVMLTLTVLQYSDSWVDGS